MIENVSDIYSIYTRVYGVDPDTVWNKPFPVVREIAFNNSKINGWINTD